MLILDDIETPTLSNCVFYLFPAHVFSWHSACSCIFSGISAGSGVHQCTGFLFSPINHQYYTRIRTTIIATLAPMSIASHQQDTDLDLTIGLLGDQVPNTSKTITWKDGHRTILPAVYDKSNVNVCDAVDIPTIKFMAQFPVSTSTSREVIHLATDALSRDGVLDAVGLSLSQNKPVVMRGVGSSSSPHQLSLQYLDQAFGISPHRPVCIHGILYYSCSLEI